MRWRRLPHLATIAMLPCVPTPPRRWSAFNARTKGQGALGPILQANRVQVCPPLGPKSDMLVGVRAPREIAWTQSRLAILEDALKQPRASLRKIPCLES